MLPGISLIPSCSNPQEITLSLAETGNKDVSVELAGITAAIMKLQPEHREILFLVCIRGMRYHDVAAALKIPVSVLVLRLHQARTDLHKRMSDPPALEYKNIPTFLHHKISQESKGR